MPQNELTLIDSAIGQAQANRAQPLKLSVAFELFAAEQAMKKTGLSPEEIEYGRIGDGLDGGIDAIYTIVGDTLLTDETTGIDDLFLQHVGRSTTITLWLIQAKTTPAFAEKPIETFSSSLKQLLSFEKSDEELLELHSPDLVSRVRLFTQAWKHMAKRGARAEINVVYVSRGDTATVNSRVQKRSEILLDELAGLVNSATVRFTFMGAKELFQAMMSSPSYTLELAFQQNAISGNGHVALVQLRDYWRFLADENGDLQRHIFDWNVRDFAGSDGVNSEIRASVEASDGPEFWWMNNGVTVVCSAVMSVGQTFFLEDVQVVNGLQTSRTIYDCLSNSAARDSALGDKLLVVRVLKTTDSATRDAVIRATNRQTAVDVASLWATDDVQRTIEEFFRNHGWYYDRRKNYYHNNGQPDSRIISIRFLAQAVTAMGYSQPHLSRGQPTTLLKDEENYKRVFSATVELAIYLWVAATQRHVDECLITNGVPTGQRLNLRFYVSMIIASRRNGSVVRNPTQLARVAGESSAVTSSEVEDAYALANRELQAMRSSNKWSLDRSAKDSSLTSRILGREFPQNARRR